MSLIQLKVNQNIVFFNHLSDSKKHNTKFTGAVIDSLMTWCNGNDDDLIRFKFDYCSCQHKCRFLFKVYMDLAERMDKVVLVYYGVAGHGEGLVDSMSAFGVKSPLRKLIVTENFFFSSAYDIYSRFKTEMKEDHRKLYFILEKDNIESRNRDAVVINNCAILHMIAFSPNGQIQTKINICSCEECIVGNFVKCNK